jgi:Tfp pilus assembly protein PilO
MRVRIGPGIWLLLGVLVCVVILMLGLLLIVFPQRSKIGDVEDQIESTEASIQAERNKLNQLKQYEKDPQQFQREIDALKDRLPERVGLADMIQQIDHAAEEAGLDFYSFSPETPVSADGLYVVTFEAVFYGRYFNLVEFFNHVERLQRTFKAVSLDITASDDGLPYLQITTDFRTYFTTDQGVEMLVGTPQGGQQGGQQGGEEEATQQ